MKLTAQIKLITNKEQSETLERTMRLANSACDYISKRAWASKEFGQYSLHKIVYRDTRDKFIELSSQMVVRSIAKVSDAYKLDHKTRRIFKPMGGITYDDRILRWYTDKPSISIWTVSGRLHLPFVCGERQKELLQSQQGESDLVYRDGKFYLFATCNIEEPIPDDFTDALGVDFGVVNIASDSDGNVYSGGKVNGLRYRHRKLRQKLQKKGTKAAKKLLKKRSGKEQRFANQENHRISKEIVLKAKDTKRAIAIENLTGIRERITARRANRAALSSWAFADLRTKIEYKAKRAGVQVITVDPRNTSRTCPICGHIDKANRKTQSLFSCVSCGYSGPADTIAAVNISRWATSKLAILPASAKTSVDLAGESPRL